MGAIEAALLYFIPRATGLVHPDVEYVIWFLAPMVDLLTGALLGLLLGIACALGKPRPLITAIFVSVGLGLLGAYLSWMLDWFRIGAGILFPRRLDASTAVEFFLVIFVIALVPVTLSSKRIDHFFRTDLQFPYGRWLAVHLAVMAVLAGGVAFYATHRPLNYSKGGREGDGTSLIGQSTQLSSPNIVLIVLDTVGPIISPATAIRARQRPDCVRWRRKASSSRMQLRPPPGRSPPSRQSSPVSCPIKLAQIGADPSIPRPGRWREYFNPRATKPQASIQIPFTAWLDGG